MSGYMMKLSTCLFFLCLLHSFANMFCNHLLFQQFKPESPLFLRLLWWRFFDPPTCSGHVHCWILHWQGPKLWVLMVITSIIYDEMFLIIIVWKWSFLLISYLFITLFVICLKKLITILNFLGPIWMSRKKCLWSYCNFSCGYFLYLYLILFVCSSPFITFMISFSFSFSIYSIVLVFFYIVHFFVCDDLHSNTPSWSPQRYTKWRCSECLTRPSLMTRTWLLSKPGCPSSSLYPTFTLPSTSSKVSSMRKKRNWR